MRFLGYSGWQLFLQVPYLLVLVTGLVLALTNRRLPRGARRLLVSGVAVLLVGAVLNLVWVLALPHVYSQGWGGLRLSQLNLLVVPLQLVLHPAGMALVVAAAFAGRRAAGPADPPPHWSGWPAPAGSPVIPPQPTQRP
ncbi:hypothetical protein GA0070611_3496 [Micromonospora auratinigra]|uniref:Uncharacterized protein n=1 Tax=Micromonospora auratinigra TaxID=261654 RepID=A0A1A8ZSA1_9ACTN|nr:hypothetical protein GA0070611_3496 [Micromonospora auratinigra]